MSQRILFVESDPACLEGYRSLLAPELQIEVAPGGAQGLVAIREHGPYAVVVADMRLPAMSGAQFLVEVHLLAPQTVTLLLALPSDLTPALESMQSGSIFRILSKPSEKPVLLHALYAALDQYSLISRENELLEGTLVGSIRLLNDVLSAANPEAYGRSMRIARTIDHLTETFHLPARWRFQLAATLSQLGCVTLSSELVQKAYTGSPLTPSEQIRFDAHPQRAMELLAHIPRLEASAWMIGQQLKPVIPETFCDLVPNASEDMVQQVTSGARMLKLAVAYEGLRVTLSSEDFVMLRLRNHAEEYGPELIDALAKMGPGEAMKQLRRVSMTKLTAGMVLDQEIRSRQGVLVVARGQEVTLSLLFKLENFARTGFADREVMALVTM